MEFDPIFLTNNLHHESVDLFLKSDPHLRRLGGVAYSHRSQLLGRLPREMPGVYSVGGGRQVGKTTLLKQWMADLLADGVPPHHVGFLTGELIDDHHALTRIVQNALGPVPTSERHFLVLDEVTYIKDWDRGVKYLADAGVLDNTVLVLTGSDLVFLQQARMRFPGRRGRADVVDFHLYPLSFREFVDLVGEDSTVLAGKARRGEASPEDVSRVFELFDRYLVHGGYLPAINDMAASGRILPATLTTYAEWLRGDIVKRGKQELLLRDLLSALIRQVGSQVTWHSLAGMTRIDHHKTIADYVEALEMMDAVVVQRALLEHKLVGAPKKARKVVFTDPFIFHSASYWLKPHSDPFGAQIQPLLSAPEHVSALVEAVVVGHYRRFFPCYYIKAQGEVDLAYIEDGRFYPVEVKWTRQIRPKDLKQVSKYPQAVILANTRHSGRLNGIPVRPLPLALLALCPAGNIQ